MNEIEHSIKRVAKLLNLNNSKSYSIEILDLSWILIRGNSGFGSLLLYPKYPFTSDFFWFAMDQFKVRKLGRWFQIKGGCKWNLCGAHTICLDLMFIFLTNKKITIDFSQKRN